MNLTRRDGSVLWPHSTPLVIAEYGVSHCGKVDALMAALPLYTSAGAYKFQYHVAELEMVPGHKHYQTIKGLEIPLDALREVFAESKRLGKLVACTAFSPDTLAHLLPLLDAGELDFIKIGSAENDNALMLEMAAQSGHPTVVSLGMGGDPAEVEACGFRDGGLAFLACCSEYPHRPAAVSLERVRHAVRGRPLGASLHTVPWSAVRDADCMVFSGAQIIEVHVKVCDDSPDAAVELNETRFFDLCAATGNGPEVQSNGTEADVAAWAKHVLVAKRDIAAGAVLGLDDVTTRRVSR